MAGSGCGEFGAVTGGGGDDGADVSTWPKKL